MEDTWQGVWYKLNLGSTPTESSTTIYNPEQTPGGTQLGGKPSNNDPIVIIKQDLF